jgi:hypothetical protein
MSLAARESSSGRPKRASSVGHCHFWRGSTDVDRFRGPIFCISRPVSSTSPNGLAPSISLDERVERSAPSPNGFVEIVRVEFRCATGAVTRAAEANEESELVAVLEDEVRLRIALDRCFACSRAIIGLPPRQQAQAAKRMIWGFHNFIDRETEGVA